MKIINIDNNRNVYYNYNSQTNKKSNTFNLKMSEPIKVDTISFSAKSQLTSAEKLKNYAIKLLDEHYFKEGQKIHITGDAKYLPLINAISAEAYKKGSGLISYKIIEPELETLKKKSEFPLYKNLSSFFWSSNRSAEETGTKYNNHIYGK